MNKCDLAEVKHVALQRLDDLLDDQSQTWGLADVRGWFYYDYPAGFGRGYNLYSDGYVITVAELDNPTHIRFGFKQHILYNDYGGQLDAEGNPIGKRNFSPIAEKALKIIREKIKREEDDADRKRCLRLQLDLGLVPEDQIIAVQKELGIWQEPEAEHPAPKHPVTKKPWWRIW